MINYPNFSSYGYLIEKELGENRAGGRVTYQAIDIKTQQSVVIKEFQFARSGASWSLFNAVEQEIEVLQQLNHPSIPRYLDAFETSTGFCLVTEYKKGIALSSSSRFTREEIEHIAIAILEILVYLQQHDPSIIHRDIKPENILIDRVERIKVYLIDFGFARLGGGDVAASSVVKGTLGFMPPEQMFNRQLTESSDLYSLGATLICLLAGIDSAQIGNLINESNQFNFKILEQKISRDFLDWLKKMVAPKLKHRFENAAVALAALRSIEVNPSFITSFNSIEQQLLIKSGCLVILGATVSTTFLGAATFLTWRQPSLLPSFTLSENAFDWIKKGKQLYSSKNYQEALAAFDRALKISSDYPKALNGKGWTLRELQRYEEALAAFDRAIEINPYSEQHWNGRGNILYYMHQYQQSLNAYNKSLEIDSDWANSWNGKGWALAKLEQYPAALAAFDRALSLEPDNTNSWNGKGWILYKLQRYQEAIGCFDRSLAIEPSSKTAEKYRRISENQLNK